MADCGNPASEQDALMLRRAKFDKTRICIKCRTNPGNVVIRHSVYCKECFFPMVATKFRKVLEPSINVLPDGTRKKGLRPAGDLCIGFSGGLGSTVLLDLVNESYFNNSHLNLGLGDAGKGGKAHPRNDGVWKKATVCYVEVCSALPGTRDRTDETAFDNAWWEKVGGRPSESPLGVDPSKRRSICFRAPNYQTAIPSAIQNLIRLLLLHTAWSTNCSHLLLGTSLTSLSVSLISNIAQGGGFVVREEAGEEWQPQPSVHVDVAAKKNRTVRVNRSLRDIGMKECTAWAWWRGLQVIGKESFLGGRQGIGALTKTFIVGLERDYPSTVSTIARTCGKLATQGCFRWDVYTLRAPGIQDWKARISIRSFADPTLASPPPHMQHIPTSSVSDRTELDASTSLTPRLCYACHTTLTSRSSRGSTASSARPSSTPLPVWVGAQFPLDRDEEWRIRKVGEQEMKESIQDFLLED
ncbi:hypothetical protein C8R46DRAFT_1354647 [Mycena filopes]|nr:hypothetical protein C8R46DRAFT_1354647 [Mycena filopes]